MRAHTHRCIHIATAQRVLTNKLYGYMHTYMFVRIMNRFISQKHEGHSRTKCMCKCISIRQIPLKILHPRSPANRVTRIPWYIFQFIPNLNFCICTARYRRVSRRGEIRECSIFSGNCRTHICDKEYVRIAKAPGALTNKICVQIYIHIHMYE